MAANGAEPGDAIAATGETGAPKASEPTAVLAADARPEVDPPSAAAADVRGDDQPSPAEPNREGSAASDGTALRQAAEQESADSKSNPVTIGFRTFTSGSECSDYFRSLIIQLSHEQDLNVYEFTMVMDLLRKGHTDPEGKIGAGVKAIQIRPHEEMDSVCFFVHRTDGTRENFSYRKCIMRLFKDTPEASRNDYVRNVRGRGSGRSSGRGSGRGRGRGRGGRGGGRGRGRGRK